MIEEVNNTSCDLELSKEQQSTYNQIEKDFNLLIEEETVLKDKQYQNKRDIIREYQGMWAKLKDILLKMDTLIEESEGDHNDFFSKSKWIFNQAYYSSNQTFRDRLRNFSLHENVKSENQELNENSLQEKEGVKGSSRFTGISSFFSSSSSTKTGQSKTEKLEYALPKTDKEIEEIFKEMLQQKEGHSLLKILKSIRKTESQKEYLLSFVETLNDPDSDHRISQEEQKSINLKKYYSKTCLDYILLFKYINDLFEQFKGYQDPFSFKLSPNIQLNFRALAIIDTPNLKAWTQVVDLIEKLNLELASVCISLSSIKPSQEKSKIMKIFESAMTKLSNYSQRKESRKFDEIVKKFEELLSEEVADKMMIDFLKSFVTSSNNVGFGNHDQNRWTGVLNNVSICIESILISVSHNIETLVDDSYGLGYLFWFIKNYFMRIFIIEMHKRLEVYSKAQNILIEV